MKKYEVAPAYSPLWKKLYAVAREFVQTEPWKLFYNTDVFIVQSPHDNQMYLCCVMGNGGQEFGLNAFRGARGMRGFYKMLDSGVSGSPDISVMYELDMLSFSLCQRDLLHKNDLTVIKKLMLSFPGGKWPLFRGYKPHYFPWFLTEDEIEPLCDCMEQTLALNERGDASLDDIRNAPPGHMLVRRKENGAWVSRTVFVDDPGEEETPEILLDDITRRRLRNLPDNGLKEEIDLVHVPVPISDHEPPYYGLLLVGINEEGVANQYGVFPPFTDYFWDSCNSLLQSFLSRGAKPRTVVLKNESSFARVFEGIARDIDITCEWTNTLPHIADFVDTMEQTMPDGSYAQS